MPLSAVFHATKHRIPRKLDGEIMCLVFHGARFACDALVFGIPRPETISLSGSAFQAFATFKILSKMARVTSRLL